MRDKGRSLYRCRAPPACADRCTCPSPSLPSRSFAAPAWTLQPEPPLLPGLYIRLRTRKPFCRQCRAWSPPGWTHKRVQPSARAHVSDAVRFLTVCGWCADRLRECSLHRCMWSAEAWCISVSIKKIMTTKSLITRFQYSSSFFIFLAEMSRSLGF